jgi:hypothetical protein
VEARLSIPALDDPIRKYISRFDIASVCIDRDGQVRVTSDPQGAAEAHWLPANRAGAVLRLAQRNGGDIVAAAKAARVRLTDHHTLITRARAAIERLDHRLNQAQAGGAAQYFNREFRERRLQASASGRRFMSYPAARARLREALAGVAAGDVPALVERVFGEAKR